MERLAVSIKDKFASPWGKEKELGELISIIVTAAIVIAGIIVLFMFVLGGISIISGAGQENPEKVAKGRQALTSAVIGFVIIFSAYWIIRVIELITEYNFITAPGI